MRISKKRLRQIIREEYRRINESFISGPAGTMAVPDEDPADQLKPDHVGKLRDLKTSDRKYADHLAKGAGYKPQYGPYHEFSDDDEIHKDPMGEYDKRTRITHPEKGDCPSFKDVKSILSRFEDTVASYFMQKRSKLIQLWEDSFMMGYNLPTIEGCGDDTRSFQWMVNQAEINNDKGVFGLDYETYKQFCDAWLKDADEYSMFEWAYMEDI